MLFATKQEKFDAQFSVRAPRKLVDAIAKIAASNGASENETRVRLLEAGVAAYQAMKMVASQVESLRLKRGLDRDQLIGAIVEDWSEGHKLRR